MNQEKFGNLIKEIRKQNNLTQKDLADKYGITYQAVSKWENGKNMPDTILIKQIAKDFNISIENMLEGNNKKIKKNILFLLSIIIIIILSLILIFKKDNNDFKFKKLSSECNNFNISGSIAYNHNKSSIFINNVEYCGGDDTKKYEEIECTLYESDNNIIKKISSCNYDGKNEITLEQFLNTVTLAVDNYERSCKEYTKNSLYLEINAKSKESDTITYKIPLQLSETCDLNK